MIDLNNLENYRENNRLEVKKAKGGFPHSVWETYSAFANTYGGTILLGVEEDGNHHFHLVGIEDPEKYMQEFWDTINNPNKVSLNILTSDNVSVEEIDGKKIVVITVPRAERSERPIYINSNLLTGSYRRNGQGDYRCKKEEVQSMLRDAYFKTQDTLVLENMDLKVIDFETVRRYHNRIEASRSGEAWDEKNNINFLYKLGGIGKGEDGKLHPTAAGLLMFGFEYEIVKEYPYYFLDYQERLDEDLRWTDRIISSSGDWSGNLYDFFFRVYNKISQDIKVPFKMEGPFRVDDTPVHKALREALANCLVNADYYGRRGLVIIKKKNSLTLSNPGLFRMDLEVAKSGGISDPRNAILLKMFNLIDIGERAGSGLSNIYSVWKKQGWKTPSIEESLDPDRTTLLLNIGKSGDKKLAIKSSDKKLATKVLEHKNAIIDYLKNNESGTSSELCEFLEISVSRVKQLLAILISEGVVVSLGANRNRTYQLKSKS